MATHSAGNRTPWDWIGVAAVVAVALAASLPGLRNAFVQDDVVLIVQNARVHDLAHWRQLLTSPYWPPPWSQDLYRPLTSLILAAEFVLGAGGPLLFRIVSYLLYAAAAVGVLVLARRLLPERVALGAALLFAAHPVHVEAVALAVAQNELLVGLLAVLMTARYLKRRRSDSGAVGTGDWAVLGTMYVAACLAKEHGLVLPMLLLSAEVFLVPGPAGPRVQRLAPGYGFLTALGILLLLARRLVLSGDLAGSFTAEALQGVTLGGRTLGMLAMVPNWARLLTWPAHLSSDYSPQEIVASTQLGLPEAIGLGVLLGAVVAVWLGRRRAPMVSFGLVWVAVALLPVSNVLIPTGIVLAERTLFLPSIGLVLAAGGLAAAAPAWGRRAMAVACGVLVAAGGLRSAERHGVWRNEETLSVRSAEDAPRSYRMQKAYGYALFESGRRERAIEAYQRAVALAPANQVWRVRNDLARRYWEEGKDQEALDQLRQSMIAAPDQEETWNYLILAYLALGAYAEAARQADTALARGASVQVFGGLRTLADSAARAGAPPGSIRIRVVTGSGPQAPPEQ